MQSLAGSSGWFTVTLSSEALITSLSAGAEQFIGYPMEELVGRPITQILADRSVFEVIRILEAANKWGYWEGKITHQARSGNHIEARGALTLLASCENHHSGYLLISNLDKSVASSECEDSIAAEVGVNLRSFAHDLNNPLAVMMGFTQLLILNTNCPGKIRMDIEKLYSELQRVVQVVERLHDYAISLCEKKSSEKYGDRLRNSLIHSGGSSLPNTR